jgi:hypothetical protein
MIAHDSTPAILDSYHDSYLLRECDGRAERRQRGAAAQGAWQTPAIFSYSLRALNARCGVSLPDVPSQMFANAARISFSLIAGGGGAGGGSDGGSDGGSCCCCGIASDGGSSCCRGIASAGGSSSCRRIECGGGGPSLSRPRSIIEASRLAYCGPDSEAS